MIEIHKVSPVHRQGTVAEYAYAFWRLQDRDFLWSHVSLNQFGIYFPPADHMHRLSLTQKPVPVRVLIRHHMGVRIDELVAESARALCDLVIKDVAKAVAETMPKAEACPCRLYGRPCGIGEFLVQGSIVA